MPSQVITRQDGTTAISFDAGRVVMPISVERGGIGYPSIDVPGSPVARAVEAVATSTGYRFPALQQFWSKLATVDTDGVDIVTIGDSNTEGGATVSPDKNWTNVMRDQLRRIFQPTGVTGGFGYMPGAYAHSTPTDHFAISGSAPIAFSAGLGRRRLSMAQGATATATFTGTKCRIFFVKGTTAGRTFAVSIDGSSTTGISSYNNASTVLYSQTWDSGTLSAGAHTVIVTATDALSFEGMMTWNGDESAGIRTWQGGHTGYRVEDFLLAEPVSLGVWQNVLPVIDPDLVIMMWGTNDYRLGTTLSAFRTNLQTLVSEIRTKVTTDPSIVLAISPERYDVATWTNPSVPVADYGDYATVIKEVALADGNLAFIDLRTVVSTNGDTNGTGSTNADKVHFTTVGQGMIGRALARFVAP